MNTNKYRDFVVRKTVLTALLIFVSAMASAQEVWEESKFDEEKLKKLIGTISPIVNWTGNNGDCFYSVTDGNGNRTVYLIENKGRRKTKLFDNIRLAKLYNSLNDTSVSEHDFQPRSIEFVDKQNVCFSFRVGSKYFLYNRKTDQLTDYSPKKKTPEKVIDRMTTNDSVFTLKGKGHDIVVVNNLTKEIKQVSNDGVYQHSYNSVSKDIDKEKFTNTLARWIPNSHMLYVLREDVRKVGEMGHIKSITKERPKYISYKMEIPGDKYVAQYDLTLFHVDSGENIRVDIGKYKDQKVRISRAEEDAIYFTRTSRTLDTLELCKVDVKTGNVKTIVSEITHPHINNLLHSYRFIKGGKEILWWSERSGKGAYYRYTREGKLLNQVTPDDMVAGHISRIDEKKQAIIYEAYSLNNGENPHYRHYFYSTFDGKKNIQITKGEGYHNITISDDNKYVIDTYSRVDMPPSIQWVEIGNVRSVREFHQTDISAIKKYGWKAPKRISLKAKDGVTELYGLMYMPTNMVDGKKYPIISNVYPGPQSDQIPLEFDLDDNGNQDLAELGFIVINIGARGSSPYRGRDFYCYSVGNMMNYPLEDDKFVIEELAKRYNFIDIDKVGIYGHSGGAFMTVSAMLSNPDFYKVAFAASGNYDNNIYVREWGEMYQGVERKVNPKTKEVEFSCVCPTPMPFAKRLKGKLMIVSGSADKNVNLASTMRLVNAFIKEGKMVDMMIIPDADHSVASPYYYKMIRKYFKENLK